MRNVSEMLGAGEGAKHWGTLREKWEEGGGPEGVVTYRMWTDSKQTDI